MGMSLEWSGRWGIVPCKAPWAALKAEKALHKEQTFFFFLIKPAHPIYFWCPVELMMFLVKLNIQFDERIKNK